MNALIRKTNSDLGFFNSRLDEIRISGHERLKAKAQLARAEAMVEAFFAIGRGLRGLFKSLLLRPLRRLTISLG